MNRSWRRVGWLDRLPIWLTGVTLSTALIMIVGLIGFITVRGLRVFWPVPLWDVRTTEGQRYLGLIHTREVIPHQANEQGRLPQRILLRIGNRDLLGNDFVWVDDSRISSWTRPLDAVVIDLNERALAELKCEKRLEIVPGATHLFEEPGTLDAVISLAAAWFVRFLGKGSKA